VELAMEWCMQCWNGVSRTFTHDCGFVVGLIETKVVLMFGLAVSMLEIRLWALGPPRVER
jgi:hypothetical protein